MIQGVEVENRRSSPCKMELRGSIESHLPQDASARARAEAKQKFDKTFLEGK